jgi:hypothetical protein
MILKYTAQVYIIAADDKFIGLFTVILRRIKIYSSRFACRYKTDTRAICISTSQTNITSHLAQMFAQF